MKTKSISAILFLLMVLNSGLIHSQSTGSDKYYKSQSESRWQSPSPKLNDFKHNRELFSDPSPSYHFKESNDLVVLKLDSIIMNEEWKSQFTYDSIGNTLQTAYFSKSSEIEDWMPINKYEYVYNENSQITCETYFEFIPSLEQQVPITKNEYTFNNDGQLTQHIYYLINDDNVLALASKCEYTYNQNDLVSMIMCLWDITTEQWQLEFKDEFEYNDYGFPVVELRSDWDSFSNMWKASWKILSDYDSQNNQTNMSYYDCFGNPNDCSIVWQNEYLYDDNSNLILDTYFTVDEMTLLLSPNSKTQYSYDTENNLIEALDFYCIYNVDPVEWYEVGKYNSIYNEDGQISEETSSIWNFDLGVWIVTDKTETLYDDFSNQTDFIHYTYDEETGVLINLSKEIYVFDNYAVFDLLIMPIYFYSEYKITSLQNYGYDLDLSEWLLGQDYLFYYSEGKPTKNIDNSVSNLAVFPNPASDMITIEFPSSSIDNKAIEILDSNGKVVSSIQSSSSKIEIDISSYSDGIYFVHVLSNMNSFTKKIVKCDN